MAVDLSLLKGYMQNQTAIKNKRKAQREFHKVFQLSLMFLIENYLIKETNQRHHCLNSFQSGSQAQNQNIFFLLKSSLLCQTLLLIIMQPHFTFVQDKGCQMDIKVSMWNLESSFRNTGCLWQSWSMLTSFILCMINKFTLKRTLWRLFSPDVFTKLLMFVLCLKLSDFEDLICCLCLSYAALKGIS